MRLQIPINKKFVSNAYERFLELPVPVVLAIGWFMGAALIGLSALALYLLWALLQAILGA